MRSDSHASQDEYRCYRLSVEEFAQAIRPFHRTTASTNRDHDPMYRDKLSAQEWMVLYVNCSSGARNRRCKREIRTRYQTADRYRSDLLSRRTPAAATAEHISCRPRSAGCATPSPAPTKTAPGSAAGPPCSHYRLNGLKRQRNPHRRLLLSINILSVPDEFRHPSALKILGKRMVSLASWLTPCEARSSQKEM